MAGASNYAEVLAQLRAGGLTVTALEVGRLSKVDVEGDRRGRRSGWYALHELARADGSALLVGAWGNYRAGIETQKIALKGAKLDAEERAALREQARRAGREAARRRQQEAARAAARALGAWRRCGEEGAAAHPYLVRKQAGAYGIRMSPRGALMIPMSRTNGTLAGIQVIRAGPRGGQLEKQYWPHGLDKRGAHHLIGAPRADALILICEGYATGASLHVATGFPVAVAFDCGNLFAVASALAKRWRRMRILVCADDDYRTAGNPGVRHAAAAALAVNGAWVAPNFGERTEDGPRLTDFNDLAVRDGIAAVREQVLRAADDLGTAPMPKTPAKKSGAEPSKRQFSLDAMLANYALIFGTETVFVRESHEIIGLAALRAAAGRDFVKAWQQHPDRQLVEREDVVFDPRLEPDDPAICNLWGGWPTAPRTGQCERLLDLIEYLCNRERQNGCAEITDWVLDWLAYPIQHPGAKMQTAVLMHGPEGSGKNLFFGAIRQIYERYGGIFSQTELESQFNGWASGKLFMIGNEVVQRAEFYHQQGRLKNMITEPEWQVNEKNLPVRAEANHCNFVFFSNRADIAKLDPGDRRFTVIWTPPPLVRSAYEDIAEELRAGGAAALHQYLIDRDVSHFAPWSRPPVTRAKRELTDLSRDSVDQFCTAWHCNTLAVKFAPTLSNDLYRAYCAWARAEGVPRAASRRILVNYLDHWGEVSRTRERIALTGFGAPQQMRVVIPLGLDAPEDRTREQWLSGAVNEFASALRDADWGLSG